MPFPRSIPQSLLGIDRIPVRRMVVIVEVLLVLALAERTSAILVEMITPIPDPVAVAAAMAPPARPSATQLVALPDGFDPFHRGATASAAPVAAPETLLDLKLYGVRMAGDADRAGAVIRLPDLRQDAFRVGDEVLPGVMLAAVHHDRVTLERAGAQESLWLDGAPAVQATAPARADAVATRPSPTGGGPIRTTRSRAQDLAARLPTMVAARIDDGAMTGVRIVPTADPAALKPLGLSPDDVIMQVNGVRLDSQQNLEAAQERLADAGRLTLQVERAGRLDTVDIIIEGTP